MICKLADIVPNVVARRNLLTLLLAGFVLAGCGRATHGDATRTAGTSLSASTRLIDLEHPDRKSSLFSLFNTDAGVPRLVLLVSPT